MNNLFVGGSSSIACDLSKLIPNTYSISRKRKKYKKNFIVKNYSEKELKKIFKKVSKFKFDNVVIFNGMFEISFLSNFTNNHFNRMINANLKIPLLISRMCISEKIIKKNGSIFFISSLAAQKPEIGNALYAISKNALNFANQIFCLEQKKRNIRFNTISFGLVDNGMGSNLIRSIPLIKQKKLKLLKIQNVKNKFKKILLSKKNNGKNIFI